MAQKKVSVIIVSYNVQFFLELCLDSVLKALQNIDAEIFVVDNNSSDESCRLVEEKFPSVKLLANKYNAGFSKANNQALAISEGEFIHFLNPDTVLPEDFYTKSLEFLDNNADVGAVGPRIVDGRGQYAVDSKKSFPSLWTSVYKITGLSKIFPRSRLFNKYYAAHIGEYETSPIEILSGCCMLVRKSAMMEAGGGFDESYFMYCEDVDLCHRLHLQGYKNYYFPETTIIHYKGESTRKLSYRYTKIFYGALKLFVKKYYPPVMGKMYIYALSVVLAIRNSLNWARYLFSLLKLFLLDAILLTLVLLFVKDFWLDNIARYTIEDDTIILKGIPIFLAIWMPTLFFNGAYDKPFSLFKAGRGMVLGTIIVLAGYALLPVEYRFSRGIVLFTGMTGTVVLLYARWLLSKLKWIKLVPRGKEEYKALIVGNHKDADNTRKLLRATHYNLAITGSVTVTKEDDVNTLGNLSDLKSIQQTYRINEIIFNSGSISYGAIIENMERCGPKSFFKIHVPNAAALVGSNSSTHHAEEFLLEQRYKIGTADAKRNKRIIDIVTATAFLVCYPLISFKVEDKKGFLTNILAVLKGKRTWIGYDKKIGAEKLLPKIKAPVVSPYDIIEDYKPNDYNEGKLAQLYATNYAALDDLRLILANFKFLGKKSF